MPLTQFPVRLSSFVKDISKTFWNGDATLNIDVENVIEFIENNPFMSVQGLRQFLKSKNRPSFIRTGIDFKVDLNNKIRFGWSDDSSIGFGAGIDAYVYIILSQQGLAEMDDEEQLEMKKLLLANTALTDHEALVILMLRGFADGELNTKLQNKPGLKASLKFGAGGSYDWFYCREAKDDEILIEAIRDTFQRSRLPQTSIDITKARGQRI